MNEGPGVYFTKGPTGIEDAVNKCRAKPGRLAIIYCRIASDYVESVVNPKTNKKIWNNYIVKPENVDHIHTLKGAKGGIRYVVRDK